MPPLAGAPRPTATSALWAHLLRAPLPKPSDTPLTGPPSAPVDKASTSLRILLHDTQSQLEIFSEKVDKLATGAGNAVLEAKNSLVAWKTEREGLVTECVDLVNRAQTNIQNSIAEGSPSHTAQLAALTNQLTTSDKHLHSLTSQLSTLQDLTQTHTAVLASIQTTQTQILTALLPLQPLLQAYPTHADKIKAELEVSTHKTKNEIIDAISARRKPLVSAQNSIRNRERCDSAILTNGYSTIPASSSPMLTSTVSKRKRSTVNQGPAEDHEPPNKRATQRLGLSEAGIRTSDRRNTPALIPDLVALSRLPSRTPLADITSTPLITGSSHKANPFRNRTPTHSIVVKESAAMLSVPTSKPAAVSVPSSIARKISSNPIVSTRTATQIEAPFTSQLCSTSKLAPVPPHSTLDSGPDGILGQPSKPINDRLSPLSTAPSTPRAKLVTSTRLSSREALSAKTTVNAARITIAKRSQPVMHRNKTRRVDPNRRTIPIYDDSEDEIELA